MRVRSSLALFATLLLPSAAAAQTMTNVMVPMRDGTQLSTDVWRATGDSGTRPVLLRRTPYGRAIDPAATTGLTGLGYIVVSQDVRGRGDSKGTFLPFLDDAKDGFDTIEWVSKQPFSNGKVGSYGSSAEGVVQLMALGEGPPALKCAHVGVASDDLYGLIYPGGAWRTELTTNWLTGLKEEPVIPIFRQHETADTFWNSGRLDTARRAKVKASVFFMAAEFDIFSENAKTFRAFRAEVDPSVRDDQFMILGAWTHGGNGGVKQGDVTFPTTAKYEKYVEELLGYFDWCLKGGPRPTWPRVRAYVSHFADDGLNADGEWRGGDTWPPTLPHRTLYLHDDKSLGLDVVSGKGASLEIDPTKPIPSIGGGNLTTLAGPTDQTAIDARPDVFSATTTPFDKDVDVIGEPIATIWATNTTDDFDVIVRLTVMTSTGKSILLTDGIRRARFAKGYTTLAPVTPGTPTKMEVTLGPVSVKLSKGQSLRVAVQGTSAPRYEANPGVAQPLSSAPTPKKSTLVVLTDKDHPSAIDLPSNAWSAPPDPDAGLESDAGSVSDASAAVDAGGGNPAAAPTETSGGCGCKTATSTPSHVWPFALVLLALRRRKSPR